MRITLAGRRIGAGSAQRIDGAGERTSATESEGRLSKPEHAIGRAGTARGATESRERRADGGIPQFVCARTAERTEACPCSSTISRE